MLDRLFGHYDAGKLRRVLAILFLALVAPTAVIIWQGFGQLKWEAFYQARAQAQALNDRIDQDIAESVRRAEARRFEDFSHVRSEASSTILERSPLADFPVRADIPGVIGYFQVDANGSFSTPLLPKDESVASATLPPAEYRARQELADELRRILSANELVRQTAGNAAPNADSVNSPREVSRPADQPERGADAEKIEENVAMLERDLDSTSRSDVEESSYDQSVFSDLNIGSRSMEQDGARLASGGSTARSRVADLRLDDNLLKKTEAEAKESVSSFEEVSLEQAAPARSGDIAPLPDEQHLDFNRQQSAAADAIPITAFSGDIDNYDFSILNSGHFVLFRNVWRDNERFVQGLLLDQSEFLNQTITDSFNKAPLASVTDLVIAYEGNVIDVSRATQNRDYLASSRGLEGTLLYQRALSAPFDRLELLYSINQLPRGAGATVLSWSAAVLSIVFVAGFFALYRLGLGQIQLARQQQDFVSAVSHELKTPLTSIRMYGEMLREGWADEAKQKQYFEYIHDESERLTRLISNVLQLAKISHGDPDIKKSSVTGDELINLIESKLGKQIDSASFDLLVQSDPTAANTCINVDIDCFIQIMINLVDNAIKFSKAAERKQIVLEVHQRSNATLQFSIRDFGPGIPRDQMKKIFGLFYRPASELTRETVGTGIGLAIVHQLVTAMNGSVDVVNTNPGARFDVSFPITKRDS